MNKNYFAARILWTDLVLLQKMMTINSIKLNSFFFNFFTFFSLFSCTMSLEVSLVRFTHSGSLNLKYLPINYETPHQIIKRYLMSKMNNNKKTSWKHKNFKYCHNFWAKSGWQILTSWLEFQKTTSIKYSLQILQVSKIIIYQLNYHITKIDFCSTFYSKIKDFAKKRCKTILIIDFQYIYVLYILTNFIIHFYVLKPKITTLMI